MVSVLCMVGVLCSGQCVCTWPVCYVQVIVLCTWSVCYVARQPKKSKFLLSYNYAHSFNVLNTHITELFKFSKSVHK